MKRLVPLARTEGFRRTSDFVARGRRIVAVGAAALFTAVPWMSFGDWMPSLILRGLLSAVGLVTGAALLLVTWRVFTIPSAEPGYIELNDDVLVIEQPAAFSEPAAIPREAVWRVFVGPIVTDWFGERLDGREPGACLQPHLVAPNLLVEFRPRVRFSTARAAHGSSVLPGSDLPHPSLPISRLWARVDDEQDTAAAFEDWGVLHAG